MKALILSLVIAFSSSFALACTQADAMLSMHNGALTNQDKLKAQPVEHPYSQVANTDSESGSSTR